jgi:Skp family chaperone for outer membrane proteins
MIALENIIEEEDKEIAQLSRKILKLENKMTDSQIETVDDIPENDCKIDNLEKAQKEFEKKLKQNETNMITFAKHMKGVCDHVDDLAV